MEKRPRRTVFVVKGESIKCECDRAPFSYHLRNKNSASLILSVVCAYLLFLYAVSFSSFVFIILLAKPWCLGVCHLWIGCIWSLYTPYYRENVCIVYICYNLRNVPVSGYFARIHFNVFGAFFPSLSLHDVMFTQWVILWVLSHISIKSVNYFLWKRCIVGIVYLWILKNMILTLFRKRAYKFEIKFRQCRAHVPGICTSR